MKLIPSQKDLLETLILETRITGAPPSLKKLREITGMGNYISELMGTLVEAGYVAKHSHGRYVPIQDLQGNALKLVLLTIDSSAKVENPPFVKVPKEDIEKQDVLERLRKLEQRTVGFEIAAREQRKEIAALLRDLL